MDPRELQFELDKLRTQCDLAWLVTNDKWFAEQRDRIPEREIKIITKEEVTKKLRELKRLGKKLYKAR